MNEEYVLQEDGYALGFPGDSFVMRARNRTIFGLQRAFEEKVECEMVGMDPKEREHLKRICTAYTDQGPPPLTDYEKFVRSVK